MRPHGAIVPEKMDPPYHGRIAASAACVRVPTRFVRNPSEMILRVAPTFVLKYNIRTRSLADPGTIEDVLAVDNDVVPFDRADLLGAGVRPGLLW